LEERLRRELKLNSFRDLEEQIEKIEKAVGPKTTGVWSVYQILQHLTDMLHGSMHGFPKHQPKIVRMTVGKYMYNKIIKSGVMRQGYPNASAPAKREDAPIQPAIQRLKSMITEFENFNGHMAMHPFFDRLNKDEWTKLHLIHFSLHLSFITDLENPAVQENIAPTGTAEKMEEPKTVSIKEETSPASQEKVEAQDDDIEEKKEVLQVREEVELKAVAPIIETPVSIFEEKKSETTASKKTVSKKQEPIAKKKETVAKKKEPVAKKKEPVTKKKEPIAKKKEPVAKKKTVQAPPAKKKPATKKK
jgi:hypothetical protein